MQAWNDWFSRIGAALKDSGNPMAASPPVGVARTKGRRETCAVTPQSRYARTADGVHIAYQVHGEGPIDLLMVLGWTTNIEALWEEPSMARFLNRLASSSRLILFDKRGVGLSDRVPESQLPSLGDPDGRPPRRDGCGGLRAGSRVRNL